MKCANCGDPIRATEERDGIEQHDGRYEYEYVHDSGFPDLGGNPICPIPSIATPESTP